MAALYATILILHVPELYAAGGIYPSNILLLGYIAFKALQIKRIKRWPLWVIITTILVALLNVWHGFDSKSSVFFASLVGLIYVFPNMSFSKVQLARQVHIMILVSMLFLAAFVVMNLDSLGSISYSKANHYYPLATPNLMGVLALFVIVMSLENNYHWSYWGFGILSLAFMPLFLGVILALGVYAVWRLPRYFKLLVLPAAIGLEAIRFDSSSLNDTARMDTVSSFRFSIWNESLEYISENPLVGVGTDRWPWIMGKFIDPHNFMINFIMSYGYVLGILLIVLTFYLALNKNEESGSSTVKTQAVLVIMITYQLVYVGTIGHYSPLGNISTLLFGLHLSRPRDVQSVPERRFGRQTATCRR